MRASPYVLCAAFSWSNSGTEEHSPLEYGWGLAIQGEEMTSISELILVALFTGFGNAIGQYLATKKLIRNLERIVKRMNGRKR